MDLSLPELNGLDATRQILKDAPDTEVLVLTMHHSEELARDVLQAGARGYVLKSHADENLIAAVDSLRLHKPFLTSAVTEDDLRQALPILARRGVPLLVHAEDPSRITHPTHPTYPAYLASRPASSELDAVRLMIRLAEEFKARVHIVHVSSSDALPILREAKSAGLAVTAETCPHYLTFASEEIPDGATEFKCAPPIRESENRETL